MPAVFTHQFNTPTYKGTAKVNTGLFINGKFVDSVDGATFEYARHVFALIARSADVAAGQCLRPLCRQSHHQGRGCRAQGHRRRRPGCADRVQDYVGPQDPRS